MHCLKCSVNSARLGFYIKRHDFVLGTLGVVMATFFCCVIHIVFWPLFSVEKNYSILTITSYGYFEE